MNFYPRLWLAWAVVSLFSLSPPPAAGRHPAPCDQSAGAVGCIDLALSPAALTGDVYVDGTPVASQVNTIRLSVTPDAAHLIEVRAIAGTATGFGDVFTYGDVSQANVTVRAARVKTLTLTPALTYLKGFLEFTCDPRGRKTTDIVTCRPTIDGVPQADVAAGAKATYPLTPGEHIIHTYLVGDQASNWSLTARDDTVAISAGGTRAQTTKLKASFGLKGLLKISVLPKGIAADLYVDSALVAAQSASIEVYVSPGVAHTVEARAVTDPAANGVYAYTDVSQTATVSAAGSRSVKLSPAKTWLLGFLKVTCQIKGKGASDDVNCVVSVDETAVGTVAVGKPGTFNLTPGDHAVVVTLGGALAGQWTGTVSQTITVVAGRNVMQTASFTPTPLTPTLTPGTALTAAPANLTFELDANLTDPNPAMWIQETTLAYNCVVKFSPPAASVAMLTYVSNDLEKNRRRFVELGIARNLDHASFMLEEGKFDHGDSTPGIYWVANTTQFFGNMYPSGYSAAIEHGIRVGGQAHEFWHMVQMEISGRPKNERGPIWLEEGEATYFDWSLCNMELGLLPRGWLSGHSSWIVRSGLAAQTALQQMESMSGWRSEPYNRAVEQLAVERLAACHGGVQAIANYSLFFKEFGTVESAFELAYGVTLQAYYNEYEAWRARGFPASCK